MTSQAAAPARRRRAALAITSGVVVVLLIGFFIFAGLYADVLWYDQLGYLRVLLTEWLTITSLFFIGFLAMAVPVYVTIQLAFRFRPVYAKLNSQLDRYQQVIEPLRRTVMIGVPAVIGLFARHRPRAAGRPCCSSCTAYPGHDRPAVPPRRRLLPLPAALLQGLVGFLSAVLVVCVLAAIATALPLRRPAHLGSRDPGHPRRARADRHHLRRVPGCRRSASASTSTRRWTTEQRPCSPAPPTPTRTR